MSTTRQNHCIDYLELPAADAAQLGNAKRFYQTVFGWKYRDWGDSYADTSASGIDSGVSVEPSRTGRPLPVIYASDLEATLAGVQQQHASIVREIFAFPGGRRFHFLDPAGNEIAVWSDR
jgi:uncharacterized protein